MASIYLIVNECLRLRFPDVETNPARGVLPLLSAILLCTHSQVLEEQRAHGNRKNTIRQRNRGPRQARKSEHLKKYSEHKIKESQRPSYSLRLSARGVPTPLSYE